MQRLRAAGLMFDFDESAKDDRLVSAGVATDWPVLPH